MSAQGLLDDLQSLLGVLQAACSQELQSPLFVDGDSGYFADDFADEFDSLAELALGAHISADFLLEFCCWVSLVFPKCDLSGVTLHHRFNIILIIIKIYTLHSFLIFHKLINIKSVKMQNSEDSQKCSKCSSFHGDIRDFLHVIVIEIERGEYLCHDCLESTLQK